MSDAADASRESTVSDAQPCRYTDLRELSRSIGSPDSQGFFSNLVSVLTENEKAQSPTSSASSLPTHNSQNHGSTDVQASVAPFRLVDRKYWMSDENSKQCSECGAAFHTFRRRHHCRLCGRTLCHDCSSRTIDTSRFGYEGYVRVCDFCHDMVHHNQHAVGGLLGFRSSTDATPKSETPASPSVKASSPSFVPAVPARTHPSTLSAVTSPALASTGVAPVTGEPSILVLGDEPPAKPVSEVILTAPEPITPESIEHDWSLKMRIRLIDVAHHHLQTMIDSLLIRSQLDPVKWRKTVLELAQRACESVRPQVRFGDKADIRSYVKVKKIGGGRVDECMFFEGGVVCRKSLASKRMPHVLKQPKILMLSCALDFQRVEGRITSFDILREQEKEYLQILVKKILSCGAQLLLVQKSVARLVQDELCASGVTVVLNLHQRLMQRIARATQAIILASPDHIDKMTSDRYLGTCSLFRIQHFEAAGAPMGRNTLMFFEGGKADLQCTICLRGGDISELARVKNVLLLASHIGYNLWLECAYLNDVHATYPLSVLPFKESQLPLPQPLSALWSSSPFMPSLSSDQGSIWTLPSTDNMRLKSRDPESKNPDAPWLRQSLLLTVCWLSNEGQCFAPELSDVQFYSATDKTLGQFLMENCFNFKLQCLGEKCRKPAMEHVLSYAHQGGRLNISVAASPDQSVDMQLLMWTYCKVCKSNVSPCVVMSERAFAFSFGKFLELTFYNSQTICRSEQCQHQLHSNITRMFKWNGLVASFEFEPVVARRMRIVDLETEARQALILRRQTELARIENALVQIFGALLFQIDELNAFHITQDDLKSLSNEAKYDKTELLKLIPSVKRRIKIDLFAIAWFQYRMWLLVRSWISRIDQLRRTLHLKFVENRNLRSKTRSETMGSLSPMSEKRDSRVLTVSSPKRAQSEARESFESDTDDAPLFIPPQSQLGQKQQVQSPRVQSPSVSSHTLPRQSTSKAEAVVKFSDIVTKTISETAESEDHESDLVAKKHLLASRTYVAGNLLRSGSTIDNQARFSSVSVSSTSSQSTTAGDRAGSDVWQFLAGRKQDIDAGFAMIKDYVDESAYFIDKNSGLGYLGLPSGLGNVIIPVYENEPSSIVAYTLASVSHASCLTGLSEEYLRYASNQVKGVLTDVDVDEDIHSDYSHSTSSQFPTVASISSRARSVSLQVLSADNNTSTHLRRSKSFQSFFETFRPSASSAKLREDESNVLSIPSFKSKRSKSLTGSESFQYSSFKSAETESQPQRTHESSMVQTLTDTMEQIRDKWETVPLSLHHQQSLTFRHGRVVDRKPFAVNRPVKYNTDKVVFTSLFSLSDGKDVVSPPSGIFQPDHVKSMKSSTSRPSIAENSSTQQSSRTNTENTEESVEDFYICGPEVRASPAAIQRMILLSDSSHMLFKFADAETRTEFQCNVFYPKQFFALRQLELPGCDVEFVECLSRCMRFETSGGKSGSSFCKTSDDRFVFKAVQRVELNYFLENATAYFDYVAKSKFQDQPTALVKILGIYQISWEKGNGERRNPVSFIAMPNLFFRRRIAKTFDLKGSTRNRLADVKPGDSGTLLDANFLQFTNNFPILLTEASKEMLKVCVHNDTLWLSNHHLIDYSLLCGIEEGTGDLIAGIIDYMRPYSIDKQLESFAKSLPGGDDPTIISPIPYKIRFRNSMEKYFSVMPDRETLLPMTSNKSNVPTSRVGLESNADDQSAEALS